MQSGLHQQDYKDALKRKIVISRATPLRERAAARGSDDFSALLVDGGGVLERDASSRPAGCGTMRVPSASGITLAEPTADGPLNRGNQPKADLRSRHDHGGTPRSSGKHPPWPRNEVGLAVGGTAETIGQRLHRLSPLLKDPKRISYEDEFLHDTGLQNVFSTRTVRPSVEEEADGTGSAAATAAGPSRSDLAYSLARAVGQPQRTPIATPGPAERFFSFATPLSGGGERSLSFAWAASGVESAASTPTMRDGGRERGKPEGSRRMAEGSRLTDRVLTKDQSGRGETYEEYPGGGVEHKEKAVFMMAKMEESHRLEKNRIQAHYLMRDAECIKLKQDIARLQAEKDAAVAEKDTAVAEKDAAEVKVAVLTARNTELTSSAAQQQLVALSHASMDQLVQDVSSLEGSTLASKEVAEEMERTLKSLQPMMVLLLQGKLPLVPHDIRPVAEVAMQMADVAGDAAEHDGGGLIEEEGGGSDVEEGGGSDEEVVGDGLEQTEEDGLTAKVEDDEQEGGVPGTVDEEDKEPEAEVPAVPTGLQLLKANLRGRNITNFVQKKSRAVAEATADMQTYGLNRWQYDAVTTLATQLGRAISVELLNELFGFYDGEAYAVMPAGGAPAMAVILTKYGQKKNEEGIEKQLNIKGMEKQLGIKAGMEQHVKKPLQRLVELSGLTNDQDLLDRLVLNAFWDLGAVDGTKEKIVKTHLCMGSRCESVEFVLGKAGGWRARHRR